MKQKDKELLLKDLTARMMYGDAGCLWNYIISRKLEVLHKSECLYESHEIALNHAIKYCLEHLI